MAPVTGFLLGEGLARCKNARPDAMASALEGVPFTPYTTGATLVTTGGLQCMPLFILLRGLPLVFDDWGVDNSDV